ncbi:MAG TPA: MFS transporter [Devosiaceae bacterium]|jgi:predicted MFS family arabinose efflux permease
MDIRIFWLALGTFALSAESFALPSLLPDVTADTGVTLVQGGYLVLAFAMAYAIGAPILAAISGGWERRAVLAGSTAVYAIATIAAGLAASYGLLMTARIVMALAVGLYSATAQATAVAMSTPQQRARAVAVVVGGTTLAVAFGAPLGGLIANLVGWRGAYAMVAVIAVVAAVAIFLLVPAGMRGAKVPLRERLSVVTQPGVMPALIVMLLYMTGGFTVYTYIAPLTVSAVGLDKTMLPAVLLAFGIGAALGNFAGGQLADRIGALRTTLGASVLLAVILALLSVVPHLDHAIAGPLFVALVVAWGIVAWSFPPAQASRILKLAPNNAPLVLSLNWSALYFGVALGSVIGGQVLQRGSALDLGWVAALFSLAAAAVIWATNPAHGRLPAVARLG